MDEVLARARLFSQAEFSQYSHCGVPATTPNSMLKGLHSVKQWTLHTETGSRSARTTSQDGAGFHQAVRAAVQQEGDADSYGAPHALCALQPLPAPVAQRPHWRARALRDCRASFRQGLIAWVLARRAGRFGRSW